MKNNRCIITGGCGFLGRHFCKALSDLGWTIHIVDDLSTGINPESWPPSLQLNSNYTFTHQDICRFFSSFNTSDHIDLLIHLAAHVGGREIIENTPIHNFYNFKIDYSFFNFIFHFRPSKTIYVSSSAVYPIEKQLLNSPLPENFVDFNLSTFGTPDLIYGFNKLSSEYLAWFFANKFNLDIFCPRIFSGYGEDQDFSYPVPSICQRAVNLEDPLYCWGSGHQVRDFIHVDDVINSILFIIPHINHYFTCNIGTGIPTSFRKLLSCITSIIGYSPSLNFLSNKPEGVKYRFCDTSLYSSYYTPSISIKEGLKKVIDYIKFTS